MKKWMEIVTAASLVVAAGPAFGVGSGGFNNEVVSAAALGKGNASVAQADDASSMYYNPANVAWVTRPTLSLGATLEHLETEMNDPARGISESMKNQNVVTPYANFVMPLGKEGWAAGIGFGVPFGLRTEWKETGFSRYVATESEARFADIYPVVAYRTADRRFTAAVGLDYFLGDAELHRQVSNSAIQAGLTGAPLPLPDGSSRIDGDGDGWGFNVGFRWDPTEQHTFGLSYRSKAEVDLDGSIELKGLTGAAAAAFGGPVFRADASTEIDLPPTLAAGYAFRPDEAWIFEIDVQWTGWSEYEELAYAFVPPHPLLEIDNPVVKDWDDTWTIGLGGQYLLDGRWVFRAGYYFYETPIPEATFDTVVPDADRHNLTLGIGYRWENASLDLGYVLVLAEDRTVRNSVGASSGSSIDGTYESTHQLLSLGFTYGF